MLKEGTKDNDNGGSEGDKKQCCTLFYVGAGLRYAFCLSNDVAREKKRRRDGNKNVQE